MRHGDLFSMFDDFPGDPPTIIGGEPLFCQEGPFSDYTVSGVYHYGKLAEGPHAGLWVRLGASPVDMGLIRNG